MLLKNFGFEYKKRAAPTTARIVNTAQGLFRQLSMSRNKFHLDKPVAPAAFDNYFRLTFKRCDGEQFLPATGTLDKRLFASVARDFHRLELHTPIYTRRKNTKNSTNNNKSCKFFDNFAENDKNTRERSLPGVVRSVYLLCRYAVIVKKSDVGTATIRRSIRKN